MTDVPPRAHRVTQSLEFSAPGVDTGGRRSSRGHARAACLPRRPGDSRTRSPSTTTLLRGPVFSAAPWHPGRGRLARRQERAWPRPANRPGIRYAERLGFTHPGTSAPPASFTCPAPIRCRPWGPQPALPLLQPWLRWIAASIRSGLLWGMGLHQLRRGLASRLQGGPTTALRHDLKIVAIASAPGTNSTSSRRSSAIRSPASIGSWSSITGARTGPVRSSTLCVKRDSLWTLLTTLPQASTYLSG